MIYCFLFLNDQKAQYVWNKRELLSVNPNNVDYILGEFFFYYYCWLYIKQNINAYFSQMFCTNLFTSLLLVSISPLPR